MNTTESRTTAPVRVGNKAPSIHLASPVEGDWFPAAEAALFRGFASDLEDVVLGDSAFVWSSDRDGKLGEGPTLWSVPLSDGAHEITLTVTDRDGRTTGQSVHITVGEQAGPPGRSVALLLFLAGGAFLLISAGGIFFVRRGRRGA